MQGDRGASAVEFAIVLPVLISILVGIIEFGWLFNQQISLTQAAREGARAYAIHHADAAFNLNNVVSASAPAVPGVTATSLPAGGACPSGQSVVVTTSVNYTSLTGFFDFLPATLNGTAAMRCGG